MFNVFMYTAVLVQIVAWSWGHWARITRHQFPQWNWTLSSSFTDDVHSTPAAAPKRQSSADLDLASSPEPDALSNAGDDPDEPADQEVTVTTTDRCGNFPSLRVGKTFLLIGNLIVLYQLVVMPFYLVEHIFVIIMLLSSSAVYPYPQLALAFNILFFVGVILSVSYFFVSLVIHCHISKRLRPNCCKWRKDHMDSW